jgi:pyruvate,orthophosphate dikinase
MSFFLKVILRYQILAKESGVTTGYIHEILLKLSESNPMLGHRGVRLGLIYPEIYEMQVEAIFRAVDNLSKKENDFC